MLSQGAMDALAPLNGNLLAIADTAAASPLCDTADHRDPATTWGRNI